MKFDIIGKDITMDGKVISKNEIVKELTSLAIQVRDLKQGIEGYKGNNDRYWSIRAKLLNYNSDEISMQNARELLQDLTRPSDKYCNRCAVGLDS